MKNEVLARLRTQSPVSGEHLGRQLGITRSAVWKYIRELRKAGYRIDSVPSKGYSFVSAPDRLLPEEILPVLRSRVFGQSIIYHQTVSSTQIVAREAAVAGAGEGTVIIAETQSGGKGRIGRAWASPLGGIYLSIILRPEIKPAEALKLPLLVGMAVARAIAAVTALKPALKWPNDIFLDERKVGGILAEMSAEVDRLNWVIIGIGLNVNQGDEPIPGALRTVATSLAEECGRTVPRVLLLCHILAELESIYFRFNREGFDGLCQEWKAMSNTIGADVVITSSTETITGEAVDLDSDGALILQTARGQRQRIVAGDVSLRKVV